MRSFLALALHPPRPLVLATLGLLAMGCRTPEPEGDKAGPDDTSATADSASGPSLERLREALDATGHDVRDGGMYFSTYDGCCDDGAQCLGNNPATPYGTYTIPTLPDEAPTVDVLGPWGTLPDPSLTRSVHLRADEALVFIGTAPPEAAYFSLRSYQLAKTSEEGELVATLGSLGKSLNHQTVAADRGVPVADIWGEPLVVITTADQAVEARIRSTLVEAGYDPATIHVDRMTHSVLTMGLDEASDVFGVIWRTALPVDADAELAYRNDPGATLLRITPREPLAIEAPHPWPEFTRRGSGTGEGNWAQALTALEAAIFAAYPDSDSVVRRGQPAFQPTLSCIDDADCAGDIRDRLARVADAFTLEGDEFAVAFGVNHARTGKASYANVAAVESIHGIGLHGFHSEAMVGSARVYLPDEPLVDDLFAWMIRRDCTGQTVACVEIPTGCPGVETGDELRITFRAYLEPGTGVAPASWEMQPDKVIKFFPTSTR